MLDIIERFYNKIGERYKVTQDINGVFKENDIIELIEQEDDWCLSNVNKGEGLHTPYKFKNERNGQNSWMYVDELAYLEIRENEFNLDEVLNQISKCEDLGDLSSILDRVKERDKEIEFEQALKSKTLFKENKVYQVDEDEYMIVKKIDEITHDILRGDLLDVLYKENREIKLKKSSIFSHKYNTFIEVDVSVEEFLSNIRKSIYNLLLCEEN